MVVGTCSISIFTKCSLFPNTQYFCYFTSEEMSLTEVWVPNSLMKSQAVNDLKFSHRTDNETKNIAQVFPELASYKTHVLAWALAAC